jgi:hypothetical protein
MAEALAANEWQEFTWNGTTYPCSYGERGDKQTLEIGGYAPESSLTLVVRVGALPSVPENKDTVTVDSKDLEIDGITYSPCGTFVVITCSDPNKGA